MKYLIIVRHGDYGDDDRLNGRGRNQMNSLAQKLKPTVDGKSILILTSPADRARESADILSSFFNVGNQQHEILWSEAQHPQDYPGALDLVRSVKNEADVVILLTHLEYIIGFPDYFIKEEMKGHPTAHSFGKGEALIIDCQQGDLTYVRQ